MSVVIKGLPADHSLSKCMGVYVEHPGKLNSRPIFVGGRCNDMALFFAQAQLWVVVPYNGDRQNRDLFLRSTSSVDLPHLSTTSWIACEKTMVPSPSFRVGKFKKSKTMLEVKGGKGSMFGEAAEGTYSKQARIHDDKPTYMYVKGGKAIWFKAGFGWCLGEEPLIGTNTCTFHARDFAPTPDAVQSTWEVRMDPALEPRVQVALAPADYSSSPAGQQNHVPERILEPAMPEQDAHAMQDVFSQPLTLAVVGMGDGFSGLYERQQCMQDGKFQYESIRADGNRVICYSTHHKGWSIGQEGSDGMLGRVAFAINSANSPQDMKAAWYERLGEPCSNIRVTKSKKKHTKVIEVKGVPTENGTPLTLNGKYRQQAKLVGDRPTFKGGGDGKQAIWYSASAGAWRIDQASFVGTSVHFIHSKDTAATPNTVKTWCLMSSYLPTPYTNIILPTVKAAEQEVPRQMQLTMAKVMAAEQKRCLGCGHEYTLQAEVVFHEECMHHHCVCCWKKARDNLCAVCAENGD
jgi:hypothetical protein